MTVNEITFEKLPKAVAFLIEEIATLKLLLENQKNLAPPKRLPIDIEQASEVINKAVPTIYTYVRKGLIPCYKNGNRLYFYEDELLEWIEKGRRKSSIELREKMEREMALIGRGRPRKS